MNLADGVGLDGGDGGLADGVARPAGAGLDGAAKRNSGVRRAGRGASSPEITVLARCQAVPARLPAPPGGQPPAPPGGPPSASSATRRGPAAGRPT